MGGIHTHSDNIDGLSIGREVGQLVFKKASKLWAADIGAHEGTCNK